MGTEEQDLHIKRGTGSVQALIKKLGEAIVLLTELKFQPDLSRTTRAEIEKLVEELNSLVAVLPELFKKSSFLEVIADLIERLNRVRKKILGK